MVALRQASSAVGVADDWSWVHPNGTEESTDLSGLWNSGHPNDLPTTPGEDGERNFAVLNEWAYESGLNSAQVEIAR